MAAPESPISTGSTGQSPPRKRRRRWERWSIPALVGLIICGFMLLEWYGQGCHQRTVERIKEWAQTVTEPQKVVLQEVEGHLSGTPRRKLIEHQGSQRIIYTWPSIIGIYRLRAQVRQDGSVLYLDTEPNEADDFATPFLVSNDDGIRVAVAGRLPPPHRSQENRIDLVAKSREVFSKPKPASESGVVIFPVVDQQNVIVSTGPAISSTAQHSLAFTTHTRMVLDPRLVRRTLSTIGCWSPGTTIDESKIDPCLQNIGTLSYVLPRISKRNDFWKVQMEFHGKGSDQPIKLECEAKDLNVVPGAIALTLFEHLGETLSPEERQVVSEPQFKTAQDAEFFSRFADELRAVPETAAKFQPQLLVPNPRWVSAWDYYLDLGIPAADYSPTPHFPQVASVRENATISRALLKFSNTAARGTQRDFVELLKQASDLRGDAHYHRSLVSLALNQDDEALTNEMLKVWKAEDNSYPSRIARAQVLTEWALRSRTVPGGPPLTPEMEQRLRERLLQAQEDLEQALLLNPEGADAHTELIRVANGLKLPWQQIHRHFEDAIRLSPDNEQAWANIMLALWTGTRKLGPENADHMYQFANQCLDSGLWKLHVPQQVPDLLRGIAYDAPSKTYIYSQLRTPAHWLAMEKYWKQAQQQQFDETHLWITRANFARDAAIHGQYQAAAPLFDLLDRIAVPSTPTTVNPSKPSLDFLILSSFGRDEQYFDLRDRTHAVTRAGTASALPAIRVALIDDRLADAEKLLSTVTPVTTEEIAEVARLNRALAFGQRLAKKHRVKLTAEEARGLFAKVDRISCQGLDTAWQVTSDKLICTAVGKTESSGKVVPISIFFPVGLKHGIITGNLEYEGHVDSVELVAHSQALRTPQVLKYLTSNELSVEFQRNCQPIEQGNLQAHPFGFKLQYGGTEDLLSPRPEYQWKAKVFDDCPSTFGLRIEFKGDAPASISLSALSIEQTE